MPKASNKMTNKPKTNNNKPETLKLSRIGNLRNSKEIGKFVGRIVKLAARNQLKQGDITNNCYKLTVMASMLAKIIEGDELKQRIKELESALIKEKTNIGIEVKKKEITNKDGNTTTKIEPS